jgi:hypothetical protein
LWNQVIKFFNTTKSNINYYLLNSGYQNYIRMAELNGESLSFSENPSAKNEEDSFSHGKSGGSLRSQSGTLKEGKSGGSQGSGQNGIHINENIYESSSFSENPVAGSPGSVGLGKSGGSSGSGQNGSQTNKWF